MVTTDRIFTPEVARLIGLNSRVDPEKLEAALKAVRAVCGENGASKLRAHPHPFGRRPRRLRNE
jgi:hypothetical protein